jgi:hypothetical protein
MFLDSNRQSNTAGPASDKQSVFIVLARGESLSAMCAEVLQQQSITAHRNIHLLIVATKHAAFLRADNTRINAVFALSTTLIRHASDKHALGAGFWIQRKISDEDTLISIQVSPESTLTHEDIYHILECTFSPVTLPQSTVTIPTLDDFVADLKSLGGKAYLNTVRRHLSSILDTVCSNSKRPEREIKALLSILHYSQSQPLVRESLLRYLAKCTDHLQQPSQSHHIGYINRQLDAALSLLFELTDKSGIRDLASAVTHTINCLVSRGLQAPLLSRSVRQSFLKAIVFFNETPSSIDLIEKTDTEDAKLFLIIKRLLSVDVDQDKTTTCVALTRELSTLSDTALLSLARDMRRKMPRKSTIPRNLHADILAWLSKPAKLASLRSNTLSKCLLLISFNCFPSSLVLWLNKYYCTIGLEKNDAVALSALAGYDVPYIVALNKRMLSATFSIGLVPPSRSSNVVDFFQYSLNTWRRMQQVRNSAPTSTKQPLISVIFTTYKPDLALFTLSLESILHQTYKNMELIVIDDCSPANSSRELEMLIRSIKHKHSVSVLYRRNSSNVGQYVSRNLAIEMARGEYIAIQDDDDISHPERLFAQITALLMNPALIATYTNHIRISSNARIMCDGNTLGEIPGDAPASFVWRRQVFQDIGLFLPTKTRGDIEFRMRMQKYYSNAAIQELKYPLVLMRGGMETISSSKEYYYRSALSAFRYIMKYTPAKPETSREAERWIPTLLQ